MILVMNKKNGVGCTLLSYTISRLFNLQMFVNKDSFMIDEEHYMFFPNVFKISASSRPGVYDMQINKVTRYTKKFIMSSKLIIIPFEFGYESMKSTIETVNYINSIKDGKKILFILNRLDKQDFARDFSYTKIMKEVFQENNIVFNEMGKNPTSNYHLSYLRNSYSIQSNLGSGEYFLDKFICEDYQEFNFREKIENFDYLYFLYLAKSIIEQVDYTENNFDKDGIQIYEQDKDMVIFRQIFSSYISDDFENIHYSIENKLISDLNSFFKKEQFDLNSLFRKLKSEDVLSSLRDNTYIYKESKLIKDFSYIAYLIETLRNN